MGVTGDFGKLKRLRAGFEGMKTQGFKAGLCRQMGEHSRDLVLQCFENARDPYGNAWARLKYRRGRPLRLTGRLYNSITTRSSAQGWSVSTPVIYAATHNYGRDAIPRRQYIPSRGLPASWRFELVDVANAYMVSFIRT